MAKNRKQNKTAGSTAGSITENDINKLKNSDNRGKKTKTPKTNTINIINSNVEDVKSADGVVDQNPITIDKYTQEVPPAEENDTTAVIENEPENMIIEPVNDMESGLTPMSAMNSEMIYAQLGHMYRKAEDCRTERRKSAAKTIVEDHMAMRKSPELIAGIYRAKGFGVTARGYIDFINNDPIWEKHPEEQKICKGVVEFYIKHPEPPVAYKNFSAVFTNYELNPDETNKTLLVETLIWISDFISMAKATTAQITAFTGIDKARLDAICRTPSNYGYKLLREFYSEGWTKALEVRSENCDDYKDKRNKAWLRDVVSDSHMRKYIKENRVLYMSEYPARADAIEFLKEGKMLVFGSVKLDSGDRFIDFIPWTATSGDELKSHLNDIIDDFEAEYNNKHDAYRLGECVSKPFRIIPTITDEDLMNSNNIYILYVPRIKAAIKDPETTAVNDHQATTGRVLNGEEMSAIAEYYINQIRTEVRIYSNINDLLPLQMASENDVQAFYNRIGDGSYDPLGLIWEVMANAGYNDQLVCQMAAASGGITNVPVPVYAYDGNERNNPLFFGCALLNELNLLVRNYHFANNTAMVFGLGNHAGGFAKPCCYGSTFYQIPVKGIYMMFAENGRGVHGENLNVLTHSMEYDIGALTLSGDWKIADLQLSPHICSLGNGYNIPVIPETDEFKVQYSYIMSRYVNRLLDLTVRPMINFRQY